MLKTTHKIVLARLFSKIILVSRRLVGYGSTVQARRHGIQWNLDLEEGIDLSIYLLGVFERKTVRAYSSLIKENDIVLDIGANIGAHSLIFSQLVGTGGKVIAFEPTSYACQKLYHNMDLNQDLRSRIQVKQWMLVASSSEKLEPAIYSSWPLADANDLHNQHRGRLMDTSGATAVTLDEAVHQLGLKRVDFIKLDVDGHELSVIQGALGVLKEFRPKIILELAPYSFPGGNEEFDSMLNLLWENGYVFRQLSNGHSLPKLPALVRAMIPYGSGMNVLAEVS
jgi:FkbM family methyltransferase